MGDLLVRNLEPWVIDEIKAEAQRHARSLSDQANVIIIRRLAQDGRLPRVRAAELLRQYKATLAEGT